MRERQHRTELTEKIENFLNSCSTCLDSWLAKPRILHQLTVEKLVELELELEQVLELVEMNQL